MSHGAAIRDAVPVLLGWPVTERAALHGLANCGWVELDQPDPDGPLRMSAYNRVGTARRHPRFRVGGAGWLVFRELSPARGSNVGAVAQLVAHLHGMQGVRGSSPLSSTE